MRFKKQGGYVIEMVIAFMIVTTVFCTLAITLVHSLKTSRNYAKIEIQRQTELNQIGEYYLRAIEAGGTFPSGGETDYTSFSWMDDTAISFFTKYKDVYNYTDRISTSYGDFKSFYEKLSIKRRLVVSNGESNKMVIIVEEKFNNNYSSRYDVLSWSIGDDLPVSPGFEQEVTLNLLQKLWRFFGLVKNDFSTIRLTDISDLSGFFDKCQFNWRDVFGS